MWNQACTPAVIYLALLSSIVSAFFFYGCHTRSFQLLCFRASAWEIIGQPIGFFHLSPSSPRRFWHYQLKTIVAWIASRMAGKAKLIQCCPSGCVHFLHALGSPAHDLAVLVVRYNIIIRLEPSPYPVSAKPRQDRRSRHSYLFFFSLYLPSPRQSSCFATDCTSWLLILSIHVSPRTVHILHRTCAVFRTDAWTEFLSTGRFLLLR